MKTKNSFKESIYLVKNGKQCVALLLIMCAAMVIYVQLVPVLVIDGSISHFWFMGANVVFGFLVVGSGFKALFVGVKYAALPDSYVKHEFDQDGYESVELVENDTRFKSIWRRLKVLHMFDKVMYAVMLAESIGDRYFFSVTRETKMSDSVTTGYELSADDYEAVKMTFEGQENAAIDAHSKFVNSLEDYAKEKSESFSFRLR